MPSSPPDLRADLRAAHDEAWRRLGQAGTWLSGAERAAVVDESRHAVTCALCAERKQALSPFAVDGEHDTAFDTPLSASVVDAVHRITTDPSRLTRDWYEGLGLEPGVYVELLCVAAFAVGADTFHRAVGLPLRPLPAVVDGEPSREPPSGPLDHDLAWVPVRRIFAVPNVARAISYVPAELRAVVALNRAEYVAPNALLDVERDPGRAISRPEMELVAARLSALSQCFY